MDPEKIETDAVAVQNGTSESESKKRPIGTYKVKLELAILLIYFATNLSDTVFQNQVLIQTCTSIFEYDKITCEQLGKSDIGKNSQLKAIENIVQPFASTIFMTESLVQALVPAFLGLFVGAWSDKYGRKPVMLTSCIGFLIFFIVKTIIAGISTSTHVNPWVYIIASIPVSLTGGTCTMTSATFCYIADLTTFIERPYMMCMMGGIIALGTLFGQLASSYLYAASSATVVFGVSAAAELLAILYIVFFIQESVKKDQLSTSSKFRGLLEWDLLIGMLKTVFKRRPNFDRAIIWCIVIALASTVFISTGVSNVFYLFVRTRFFWAVKDMTIFSAVSTVVYFIGALAGITILQRMLGFSISSMALISFGCYILNVACYAAATRSWVLYLGVGLAVLLGVCVPMCRAMLANTVPLRDIGKVFALTSALEAIAPLISSPLYTFVYNATLSTYPGAFNLVSCGIYIISFLLIGFVFIVEIYYPNINREKL